MARTPSRDKSGLKKGTWTPEEDRKLIAYVTRYGYWNWRQLPRFAGLERCGKSCRLRWMNYLRPNIKRGNYTQEEEDTIIRLHAELGNKWSAIADHLPGRTDNEIKNHWHTTLKKRIQQESVVHENSQVSKSKEQSPVESSEEIDTMQNNVHFQSNSATSQFTESWPLSPSSSEVSSITKDTTADSNANSLALEDELAFLEAYTEPAMTISENFWTETNKFDVSYVPSEDFWTEAFQSPTSPQVFPNVCPLSPQPSSSGSLVLEDDFAFVDASMEPTIENFWTDPYMADLSQVPTDIFTQPEDLSPLFDDQLWDQDNLCEEYIGLFQ
ncbi:hypothetical protein L6164_022281 [Bauhinia variegata]|uniref:Uncharacterized protein n=1 Tax=Bauhinia variegata TaxID=167791 RepID=A0ACB9MEI9_BAUVA|nr:hypothetical protein L6164_022281 [Bauhinia variegata]